MSAATAAAAEMVAAAATGRNVVFFAQSLFVFLFSSSKK
jgi:hypothetical protein